MSFARGRKPTDGSVTTTPAITLLKKEPTNKLDLPLVQKVPGGNAIRRISNSVLDFLCHPPPLSSCLTNLPFVIAYASPLDAWR